MMLSLLESRVLLIKHKHLKSQHQDVSKVEPQFFKIISYNHLLTR